jgi:phage tail sheath protein FI
MGNLKHGVYSQEQPTKLLGLVAAPSALPFVVGTAPVHTVPGDQSISELVKLSSWQDVLDTFGYVKDFQRYTLIEFLYAWFRIYGFAPVIAVNVFDPSTLAGDTTNVSKALVSGEATVEVAGVCVQEVNADEAGLTTYVENVDYSLSYDEDGYVTVTRLADGAIPADTSTVWVAYKTITADRCGVQDAAVVTGLELIETGYAQFSDVPSLICSPGFSHSPTVKASMINATDWGGCWKAFALTDVDCSAAGADALSEVAGWKSTNSYTDPNQDVYWPLVKVGDDTFHLSTIMAGAMAKMDNGNGGVPCDGASNIVLPVTKAVNQAGAAIWLTQQQANDSLNANGVTTVINQGARGWVSWGNRTGAYPGVTDPKDMWRNYRRMLNYLQNSITLTMMQKVDRPGNYRQIEAIINSVQIWLNGLAAAGALIGQPKIQFRREDNPTTELINGRYVFAVTVTPPTAMESITFTWEIDVTQFDTLFA